MALSAYLQHGKWGGPYRTESVEVKETEMPANPYVSGYGKRIPTGYMIKYNGKWRRVYCVCFSNSGTCYIGEFSNGIVVRIDRD